jgi:hypothetical protein
MDQEMAYRAYGMAEDGELHGKTEEELIELLGPPTWRYDDALVWDLHPYIWEGRVTFYINTGEVASECDQGGAV